MIRIREYNTKLEFQKLFSKLANDNNNHLHLHHHHHNNNNNNNNNNTQISQSQNIVLEENFSRY